MKLVEIIRGLLPNDAVYEQLEDIRKKLGKLPVEVNDFPRFCYQIRILATGWLTKQFNTLYEGVATKKANWMKSIEAWYNHTDGAFDTRWFIV